MENMGGYFVCFLICATLSLVSSITLPYMVTNKPLRHTNNTNTTTVVNGTKIVNVAATTATKGVVLYKVTASNGATCILLEVDGLIELFFKSHAEEYQSGTYMADGAAIEGNCKYEDSAFMTIKWNGYMMIWNFAETPGGERWYVSEIELTVSTELEYLHSIKAHVCLPANCNGERCEGKTSLYKFIVPCVADVLPEKSFKLVHAGIMLFQTPVGKSYACEESIVDLSFPKEVHNPANLTGRIFLRMFQLQPFMEGDSNFDPAIDCESEEN